MPDPLKASSTRGARSAPLPRIHVAASVDTLFTVVDFAAAATGKNPMLKTILSAISMASVVTVATAGMFILSSSPAFAERPGERPVNDSTASRLYSNCMLTSDNVLKSGSSYDRCCSKSLGYCIKCPKSGGVCVRSPNRFTNADHRTSRPSGGDVLAPTPDKTVPGSSGPRLKLNLRQKAIAPNP